MLYKRREPYVREMGKIMKITGGAETPNRWLQGAFVLSCMYGMYYYITWMYDCFDGKRHDKKSWKARQEREGKIRDLADKTITPKNGVLDYISSSIKNAFTAVAPAVVLETLTPVANSNPNIPSKGGLPLISDHIFDRSDNFLVFVVGHEGWFDDAEYLKNMKTLRCKVAAANKGINFYYTIQESLGDVADSRQQVKAMVLCFLF